MKPLQKKFLQKTMLVMPKAMRKALAQGKKSETFAAAMSLQGMAFRDVPGRKTSQVMIGDKRYFIKQHFGVGWAEIFKNLVTFKQPVLGAITEVQAIKALEKIGIPTTPLVAFGQRGLNPARLQSFVMTEDLGDIVALENIVKSWKVNPPTEVFKTDLLTAAARLAAKLHSHGLCHRDFYLCHLVVKRKDLKNHRLELYLIDLHRVLQNQAPSSKAVMKDMAALCFSALECGLTESDLALIKQEYLPQSEVFWHEVDLRAQKLLTKFNSARFQARLQTDRARLDKDES